MASQKNPEGSSVRYFILLLELNLSYGMAMVQLLWDQTSKVSSQ